MRKKVQPKVSASIQEDLKGALSVFTGLLERFKTMKLRASEEITAQENSITAAQMEIASLRESIDKISAIETNINNLLQPVSGHSSGD